MSRAGEQSVAKMDPLILGSDIRTLKAIAQSPLQLKQLCPRSFDHALDIFSSRCVLSDSTDAAFFIHALRRTESVAKLL
jgi:hypothetical protein